MNAAKTWQILGIGWVFCNRSISDTALRNFTATVLGKLPNFKQGLLPIREITRRGDFDVKREQS